MTRDLAGCLLAISEVTHRYRGSVRFVDEGLMAEVVSPAVARRRVGLTVREAREAAGLTQHEVAEDMECSPAKVIRIETGEVSVSPDDPRRLGAYFAISKKADKGAAGP